MNDTPVFSTARLLHAMALAVMFAALSNALSGITGNLPAALALGLIFTGLLKLQVQAAAEAAVRRQWWRMAAAAAGVLLVGGTTTALTAATLYERFFAVPSAVRDFSARREPVERALRRTVGTAEVAVGALQAWAKDAAAKAQRERTEGGSCPARPDTRGMPGVIARWRDDDAAGAAQQAQQLGATVQQARQALDTLAALPRPADYDGVRAGLAAANRALDAAAALGAGGHITPATLAALRQRAQAGIVLRSGEVMACGDGVRALLVAQADAALAKLAAETPLPRLQPGVDLSDRHDLATRAWLRGYNGLLMIATLGAAGSFADDPLMQAALREQGVLNRETLMFVIAMLAEAAVVMTALLARRQGGAPVSPGLAAWLEAGNRPSEAGGGTVRPMWQRGLLRAAQWLAGLFFVRPGAPALPAPAGVHGSAAAVPWRVDPACRPREAAWAAALRPWTFQWRQRAYLLLPLVPTTEPVRHMAHALRDQGALRCLSSSAAGASLSLRADMAQRLQTELGESWPTLAFEVFELGRDYAQVLRLQAVAGLPVPPTEPAREASEPGPRPPPHRSLRARLALRHGVQS